jgi:tRNA threonylcarbamoyladenosine biosynthesis protein TsaB
MICLAIDTAGPVCAAALAESDAASPLLLASESQRIGRGHAERLMPMIANVLERAGVGYSDLGLIAVTTGPGSFTGVRIGVSAARGLALALGIDARGLSVLDVLCEQARNGDGGTVAALLDAGHGDVFIQAVSGAPVEAVLPAARMPLSEAAAALAGRGEPISLIGSAAPALIAEAGDPDGWSLSGTPDHADIGLLAVMALAGAGALPPRPLYLRAPDAKPQTGKAVARA